MKSCGRRKVLIVGSSGGHLLQMLRIAPAMHGYDQVWVSFQKPDAQYLLREKRVYWCHFPTTRNLWNLFLNTCQALRVLLKERPQIIVSSGAAVAVPYFYLGKLFRCKTVFVEAFNRIDSRTLTGKLVYRLSDLFCVQWPEMVNLYPSAKIIGPLP